MTILLTDPSEIDIAVEPYHTTCRPLANVKILKIDRSTGTMADNMTIIGIPYRQERKILGMRFERAVWETVRLSWIAVA